MKKKLSLKTEALLDIYRKKKLKIATAESCTGGMVAQLLTDIAGSSDVFECAFVTYSNASKHALLGVPEALIAKHGAVSAEVAEAMARGAVKRSGADVAVAITGVAGPGGGSKKKPVGLVYIAAASRQHSDAAVIEYQFEGDRAGIRAKAAGHALTLLKKTAAFL